MLVPQTVQYQVQTPMHFQLVQNIEQGVLVPVQYCSINQQMVLVPSCHPQYFEAKLMPQQQCSAIEEKQTDISMSPLPLTNLEPPLSQQSQFKSAFTLVKRPIAVKKLPRYEHIDLILQSAQAQKLQYFTHKNNTRFETYESEPCFQLGKYSDPIMNHLKINARSKNITKKQTSSSGSNQDSYRFGKHEVKGPFQIIRNAKYRSNFINIVPSKKDIEYKITENVNLNGFNNLTFFSGQEVLTQAFMEENQILPDNQVAIVQGNEFNPRMFGYSDHVPNSTNYVFYFIKKEDNLKKQYRLFECHHEEGGVKCNKVIQGMSKFFAHLRVHTREKPYKCTYTNCGSAFCQMGNLQKHIEAHAGIKKFKCTHCERQFSKNFNLKIHLKSVEFKKNKEIQRRQIAQKQQKFGFY